MASQGKEESSVYSRPKAGELEAHKPGLNHPRQTEKPRTVAQKGKFEEGLGEWLAEFSWILSCLWFGPYFCVCV